MTRPRKVAAAFTAFALDAAETAAAIRRASVELEFLAVELEILLDDYPELIEGPG